MTDAARTPPAGLPPPPAGESRWAIVGRMFRRKRTAVWGLRVAWFLFVLAVYAPLLACDLPFFFAPEGGPAEYPWFGRLFDRIAWEHGLDRCFNAAMFTLPLWWLTRLGVWLGRPAGPTRRRVLAWAALGLVALTFLLPQVLATSQPHVDWRARAETLRKAWEKRPAEERADRAPYRQWIAPVPYGYGQTLEGQTNLGFAFVEGGHDHLLGTDKTGRDVLARLLYGTRISLTIGVVAVSIYVLIGTFLGALAGYYGGRVDLLIMRFVEVLICIPGLFLILTIVALFEERTIFVIMGAIGIVSWTGITRLVRGEFMRERHREYVDAARSMGFSDARIVFRHILPNALGPVLVAASFGIPGAILVESGLAFLGLGDLSIPSWGRVLDEGRRSEYWHLILPPSVAIFVTVTALNLVGDGLRDALDPKLRR